MDRIVAAKLAIALAGVATALVAARTQVLLDLPQRDFDRLLIGAALASRLGLFILVYGVLGFQAQSDALAYYDWSRLVLAGHVPGESEVLPLHYGPLFLYLTATPLLLVDSSRAIVAVSIAFELISIPIWLAVARMAFPETVARRAMLLYVASPFALLTSVIGANNDVIVSVFVALAMWLLLTRLEIRSALILGLGVLCSKLLAAAAVPVLLLKARRPVVWSGTFAAVLAVGYCAWALMGINPISGLRFHSQHFSSGNIPFLLGLLDLDLMQEAGRVGANIVGMAAIAGILGLALLRRQPLTPAHMCALLGALFAAFMLASAKAFAHYWIIALVPALCALAADSKSRWPTAWYAIFSLTTSVESTIWFRLFDNIHPSAIVNGAHAWSAGLGLFLVAEVLLIASYGAALFYCCRALFRDAQPCPSSA